MNNKQFVFDETTLKYQQEKDEIRQILFDKLKEMAEIKFGTCTDSDYARICVVMNDIARTLLGK